MNVIVKGKGAVTLDKRHYLASGGEGSVYVKDGIAYKLYNKTSHMIPEAKIFELSGIATPHVIKPECLVLDPTQNPIGYSMKYISDTIAVCQLFTKAFKVRNAITPKEIIRLILQMKDDIEDCHKHKVLIVDLNELNLIIDKQTFTTIYFIDVDSYQTPSFPATAIMDSIRDRHAKKWSEESDWFSFAIITFQMFTGIHPYKGKHQKYKTLDDRMTNNVSVFNSLVSIPPIAENFDVIPQSYRDWYFAVFEEGKRLFPPDSVQAVIKILQPRLIQGTNLFTITKLKEVQYTIIKYIKDINTDIILTEGGLYLNDNLDPKVAPYSYIGITPVFRHVITAIIKNKKLCLYNATAGQDIDFDFIATDLFTVSDRIYLKHGDNISELQLAEPFPNRVIPSIKPLANILYNSTQVFNGFAIQDMLGTYYVSLFPKSGIHYQIRISELNGFRIIDGKYESNVLVIIGEQSGVYSRFVIRFSKDFSEYNCTVVSGIQNLQINFTVLDNEIVVSINDDHNVILLYSDLNSTDVKEIQDQSFLAGFFTHWATQTLFIRDSAVYSIKLN